MGWISVAELAACAVLVAWALGIGAALTATAAGALAAGWVVRTYLRRLGGITGDGVGAATELYELAFLGITLGFI
jgi:cobalamin synthase